MKVVPGLLVVMLALGSMGEARAQMGCGLLPLKPLVPLGCRDLKPLCQCDKDGKNCVWVWVCVK